MLGRRDLFLSYHPLRNIARQVGGLVLKGTGVSLALLDSYAELLYRS